MASSLQMARQIELDGNSIRSAESIRIDYSQLYPFIQKYNNYTIGVCCQNLNLLKVPEKETISFLCSEKNMSLKTNILLTEY